MCGICGIVWSDRDRPAEEALVRRMMEKLVRRGPDEGGTYVGAGGRRVALGHRRLAVIDLETGAQPMTTDSGLAIVFNGEVFNFRELRTELEARGKAFRTKSDTEVILRVFEEEGERTPASLDGQFAFAVWDETKGELFAARDRLGEKPFFYYAAPDRFVFASSLEALLAGGDVPREIDPVALEIYLTFGYVPAPRTIFKGVSKLPPGSTLVWRDGAVTLRRYWACRPEAWQKPPTEEALEEELRERLAEAVRTRLVADVPLGAFLSGGVDSSIIVALMAEGAKEPVRTFAVGFTDPLYNELAWARAVAERNRTQHREFLVGGKGDCPPGAVEGTVPFSSAIHDLVSLFGEPFADSSAIPMYYLARETRAEVKVALSGDGGDELFGGYDRYRALRLASVIDRRPKLVRRMLAGVAKRMLRESGEQRSRSRRSARFFDALERDPVERYLAWMSLFDGESRAAVTTEEFRRSLGDFRGEDYLREAFTRLGGKSGTLPCCAQHPSGRKAIGERPQFSSADRAMAVDLETYLPGDLLVKADVASMAWGLEVRCPFLDHRLVEFARGIPPWLKLSALRGKKILRQAFRDKLPPEVRRRRKMGFGVPLGRWFRGELKGMLEETLLAPDAATKDVLRPEALRALVDEHQSARADHGQRLYALLFLELWWRGLKA